MFAPRSQLSRCLLAGGVLFAGLLPVAAAQAPGGTAAAVKQLFTERCLECHGGKKTSAGVKILDRDLLVGKKKIVPGKPGDSLLLQLLTDKTGGGMPPPEKPPLTAAQIDTVRRWLAEGAPPFPADAATAGPQAVKGPLGVRYVLKSILDDVRRLPDEQRRSVRYFSLVHVLNAGTTKEELDQHRDALTKTINHLTWKRNLVRPVAVEPTHTVFRVDLRDLGWDLRPYRRVVDGKPGPASPLNLWDLVLLEYPYGQMYEHTDVYSSVLREFLVPAGQVRPVAFVRADWFVSVATQPPLYHDLLLLPQNLGDLEKMLKVDADDDVKSFRAVRGGMIDSGVSRNNRAVERHATAFGAYWKSADFKTSSEKENLLADPINLHPTGGEMIFNLPNGLQGYYVANAKGERLDSAPTEIVTDKLANDKIVRNGLSCIRCHDVGMKEAKDVVRPTVIDLLKVASRVYQFDQREVLRLYPPQERLDRLLEADGNRFQAAMRKALGKEPAGDPVTPVSQHFLYERLTLAQASAELGLAQPRGLKDLFVRPEFVNEGLAPLAAGRPVARDAWEDYYDRVARQLGLGKPVVALDGLARANYQTNGTPFTLEVRTNKGTNTFEKGKDEVVLFVKASKDVHVEVIATGSRGHKSILVPATTRIKAGEEFRFPPKGRKLTAPAVPGQEEIAVIASETGFPAGELLRGNGVSDRVVHAFAVRVNGKKAEVQIAPDPARTVKKTIALTVQ
jgi:serine/threonine-protein kinase